MPSPMTTDCQQRRWSDNDPQKQQLMMTHGKGKGNSLSARQGHAHVGSRKNDNNNNDKHKRVCFYLTTSELDRPSLSSQSSLLLLLLLGLICIGGVQSAAVGTLSQHQQPSAEIVHTNDDLSNDNPQSTVLDGAGGQRGGLFGPALLQQNAQNGGSALDLDADKIEASVEPKPHQQHTHSGNIIVLNSAHQAAADTVIAGPFADMPAAHENQIEELSVNSSISKSAQMYKCQKRYIPQPEQPNPTSFVCVCTGTYCDEPEPWSRSDFTGADHRPALVYYTTDAAEDRLTKRSTKFQSEDDVLSGNQITDTETHVNSYGPQRIINIDAGKSFQTILGFGGAMTDAAGITMEALSPAAKEQLLKTYYDKNSGIGYSICRVPMASCDFSTHEYSYLDKEGDFDLETFALADEDFKYKIPNIIRAMNLTNDELLLFSSPWSAPGWMKTNGRMKGGFPLKSERRYYETWAKYFKRFFEEYAKNGIHFWGLTMQNEPRSDPNYSWQTMDFGPSIQRDFAYELLSPALKSSELTKNIKIMAFDDNRGECADAAQIFYKDPVKAQAIDGMALHWYDHGHFSNLTAAHNFEPAKFLLSSEQCIDTAPKVPLFGDWSRGERYGVDIVKSLSHWSVGWVDWNICVDMQGGPNWVGNWVDAPIVINKDADEFYKQPIFYFMAHFSKFVPRGSVRIYSSQQVFEENGTKAVAVDEYDDAKAVVKHVAFLTPTGEHVLVLINTSPLEVQRVEVKEAERTVRLELQPSAIVTAIWRT